ncbi:MAG: DNA primase catalytic subunit PriS [Methanomassiliicoccaceae archaeon]|nr:DNA primase catalytic subunit PriS [Methanomassiliicoccaceae archaeon]MCL2143659.1 DNA primase catalytic subunit PriS [Methanomassiliicoccaceae archaeon]
MDQNSRFLLKAFRRYYKANAPVLPERFGRREFGFMFFDRTFVQRHLGFTKADDVRRFLIAQVPSHCYYSTAYYRDPAAPTMDEKMWLGADLIFDLDADHLKGADKMTYAEMLEQIKKEMINLVDSFICGDLGFKEEEVNIVFSGGRGYHAHVSSPKVLTLGSPERREIVDYVTSKGLDMNWTFPEKGTVTSAVNLGGRKLTNVTLDRLIPKADSGGWRLRLRDGLAAVADDLMAMDAKELKKKYPSIGKTADKTIAKVKDDVASSVNAMFERNTMATLTKKSQEILMRIMSEDVVVSLSGEVDEPVTADIKRLIRLPGSVHGKSGLRVTPLSRNGLDDFDPLEDAVPKEYSSDAVKITMKRDTEITMLGERMLLKGETEVPEYAAVFLIGRKLADHGHGIVNE